jgi:acyl-CoA reductase-like NAD-dependent aldehyde dehydrogenase
MDREEIIRMALEACDQAPREDWNSTAWVFGDETLERFAALVAAHEREACAKLCEEVESRAEELWDKFAYPEDQGMASGARQCTTAIRARGEK